MLKRIILLSLVILAGCSNPPAPKETTVKKETAVKPKAAARPAPSPWVIGSYAPKEGETEGRKFVRFVTEGTFSDPAGNRNYLFAEVIVNKANAGILLRKLKKSNPAEKFGDPVTIKLTSESGQELQMTSSRSWNSSGGIMIERNNNDYSQFRIFLLQNKGVVTAEIRDAGATVYNFTLNVDGFSDSFSKI